MNLKGFAAFLFGGQDGQECLLWIRYAPEGGLTVDVFVSWSGETSKAVAQALWKWMPNVIQSVKCFMSDRSIGSGMKWLEVIGSQLRDTRFGISCLTPDNLEAIWLHFEAGALANRLEEKARVCPYLFQVNESDIPEPLKQFHAEPATKDGTYQLIQAVNQSLANGISDKQLEHAFEREWPSLIQQLESIPEPMPAEKMPPLDQNKTLIEILGLVREIARNQRPAERLPQLTIEPSMFPPNFLEQSLKQRTSYAQAVDRWRPPGPLGGLPPQTG